MTYKYETVNPNENQYFDFDLESVTSVPARYVKSKLSCDIGNFLIEALPPPRMKNSLNAYLRPISEHSLDDLQSMTQFEKMLAIRSLRHYRSPLPFHEALEYEFNLMLVESYRNRQRRMISDGNIKIVKGNQEEQTNIIVRGKIASSANAGCALIGYSGCGKSSALEILLSNYPQVIEHSTEQALRLTQIVYLPIVCPTNSNFSALYSEIGAAIDRALGNTEPVYEHQVNKRKTLPDKANYICDLIEKFAIGCIIFDEIQLIDFHGQKENTFESLLTIVNKTKVALLTVGTEDALQKMYPNLRTGRRAGSLIEASRYCTNRAFFDFILEDILSYQWIEDRIQPTQEIKDAFYQISGGIIDQLIGVYMFTQIDYLLAPKKYKIEPKHILKAAKNHYPGLQGLLKTISDFSTEKKRKEIMNQADLELSAIIQQQRQDIAMNAIMSNTDRTNLIACRDNIIHNVKKTAEETGERFTLKEIERAVDAVMNKSSNQDDSERVLSDTAYKLLQTRKQNKHGTKANQKVEISSKILLDTITKILPPTTDRNT